MLHLKGAIYQENIIFVQKHDMSYTRLIFHIVFRTKYNKLAINQEYEKELYAYIHGIAKSYGAYVYRIGGMPDHLHILLDFPAKVSLSEFMRELKKSSSKWMRESGKFPAFEGWGEGYAAFSYSRSDVYTIINYIKNQKEHHKNVPFVQELRKLLTDSGIDIDERYFLKH